MPGLGNPFAGEPGTKTRAGEAGIGVVSLSPAEPLSTALWIVPEVRLLMIELLTLSSLTVISDC